MAHEERRNRGPRQDPDNRDRSVGQRPNRIGDRHARGLSDDPYANSERYPSGAASGYGSEDLGGPETTDPDRFFSAPGFDPGFDGPRFDRADVGSTGTHGVHPVSSAFGGAYGAGYATGGSSARRQALMNRENDQNGGQFQDPHYAQWRNRQVEQLDRDYAEYHRERQERFDREFGEWREQRGRQRQAVGRVREHMEVIGSDGRPVGTVDGTRDERIILTRSDSNAGGIHHSIPCSWVETVEDKVRLNISADEAIDRWKNEERSQALFDRE